jgi:hypothetical protein
MGTVLIKTKKQKILDIINDYVFLATGQNLTEEDDYDDFLEALDDAGL